MTRKKLNQQSEKQVNRIKLLLYASLNISSVNYSVTIMTVQPSNSTMTLDFVSSPLNPYNSTAGDYSLCQPKQENQHNPLKCNKTKKSSHT